MFFLFILFTMIAIALFSKWLILGPKFNFWKKKLFEKFKRGEKKQNSSSTNHSGEGKENVDAYLLLNEQTDANTKTDLKKAPKKGIKFKKQDSIVEEETKETKKESEKSIQDLLNENE